MVPEKKINSAEYEEKDIITVVADDLEIRGSIKFKNIGHVERHLRGRGAW